MVCTVTTDRTGATVAMSVSQNVTRTNGNFARGRFSVPRACEGTQRRHERALHGLAVVA